MEKTATNQLLEKEAKTIPCCTTYPKKLCYTVQISPDSPAKLK